jgi:hypothetical protein
MVIGVSASRAGNYYQDAELNQLNASTAAIALGDVLYLDTADNKFKTAPTGSTGRFAVAVKTKPLNDTEVLAAVAGHVDVTAQGAIAVGNPVMVSGTTAGRVSQFAATGSVTDFRKIVGFYVGKGGANNNEREGTQRTAAADGDIVTIKLVGVQ